MYSSPPSRSGKAARKRVSISAMRRRSCSRCAPRTWLIRNMEALAGLGLGLGPGCGSTAVNIIPDPPAFRHRPSLAAASVLAGVDHGPARALVDDGHPAHHAARAALASAWRASAAIVRE